jgi:heme exporter protein D
VDPVDARHEGGNGMNEFLAMGGHGFFVWGSYGVTAAVIVVELFLLRARRRAAVAHATSSGEPR